MNEESFDTSYLNDFGRIIKIFRSDNTLTEKAEKRKALLTPLNYGTIELDSDFIQERLQHQANKYINSAILSDTCKKIFAFNDFRINESFAEKKDLSKHYCEIMQRIKKGQTDLQNYHRKKNGTFSSSFHYLEYDLLHVCVNRMDKNESNHLIVFSLVNNKETVESFISKNPLATINPGQIISMIEQISETIKGLFYHTDIFFPEQKDLQPLLPCVPTVTTKDIWYVGKNQFRLNWLLFESEKNDEIFTSDTILKDLIRLYKTTKVISTDYKNELYAYSLNSLAIVTYKFYLLKTSMNSSSSIDVTEQYTEEIAKKTKDLFKSEFPDEGEYVKHLFNALIDVRSLISNNLSIADDIEIFQNSEKRPTSTLIANCLRAKNIAFFQRNKIIKGEIKKGGSRRELEVKVSF